jgi:hypothetical protein
MTPQEALNKIDETVIGDIELKVFLSKALEKQIPKKPIGRKDTTYSFCPCCESGNLQNDYCTDCGQKIDWSDTE